MYSRISAFIALAIGLTTGSAFADQIYGVFKNSLDQSSVRFFSVSNQNLAQTAISDAAVEAVEAPVPAGSFSNLACVLSAAPGLTHGWLFHLVKNGIPTALTCSVENTAEGRSCFNFRVVVAVAELDRVALQITPDPGVPNPASGSCTVRFR
jgi:hypothetical protein